MKTEKTVPAPLYRDPIYDAPTDPVIIWNREEKCWWMLYTQRRDARNSIGVAHIHGNGYRGSLFSGWLQMAVPGNPAKSGI